MDGGQYVRECLAVVVGGAKIRFFLTGKAKFIHESPHGVGYIAGRETRPTRRVVPDL